MSVPSVQDPPPSEAHLLVSTPTSADMTSTSTTAILSSSSSSSSSSSTSVPIAVTSPNVKLGDPISNTTSITHSVTPTGTTTTSTTSTTTATTTTSPTTDPSVTHPTATTSDAAAPVAPVRKRTLSDYSLGRTLGEGSYSTVVAAVDKSNKRDYAIKVLDKRHIIREKKVKYVNIEKNTLYKLDHPGVVKLYSTFQDGSSL
ncbi:pkb-activating kinase-like protein, partial [Entomortierella lignicola]